MVCSPTLKVNDDVAFPANVSAAWPATLPELAASIVHEVNQPLSVIVAGGRVCLRRLADDELKLDETRATIAAMIKSAMRASGIIRSLYALATGAQVRKGRLDLNEIIERAIPLIANEVRRNGILLKLDLAPQPLIISGDRFLLQQLIVNLAFNGIQAMVPVHGRTRRLRVQSRRYGTMARVTIQDTGVGLSPHGIDRSFERFHTTKAGGMGVGLPICRSIVAAHGGAIGATSNAGHGAAFCFTLPLLGEEPFLCRPATRPLKSTCRRCRASPPAKETNDD